MTQLRRLFCLFLAVFPEVFAQNVVSPTDAGRMVPELRHKPNNPMEEKVQVMEEPVAAASGYAPTYGQQSYGQQNYGGNNNYGGGYDSGYGSHGAGCYGRPAGTYGDASYDCKTFQVCQADGRLDTMYCPPYTRFNNYLGVCDWHFKVDAYCNPLYKEEYVNNYGGSNYGSGNNYNAGNSYSGAGYGSPQPIVSFEAPYQGGNNYGQASYGAINGHSNGYQGSNNYGGGAGYGGGVGSYGSGSNNVFRSSPPSDVALPASLSVRPPVYNLMSFGGNTQSALGQKYRR